MKDLLHHFRRAVATFGVMCTNEKMRERLVVQVLKETLDVLWQRGFVAQTVDSRFGHLHVLA